MEVLHLISNRDNSGGSTAAINLHNALLKQGYKSSVLSSGQLFGYRNGNGYRHFGGLTGRLQQAFLKLENMLAKPGHLNPIDKLLVKKELQNYNGIIHLHVTHVAQVSFKMIEWLCKGKKVFWTLHDLWPITGKCIHPTYCKNWLESCNNCPKLNEYPILNWDNTTYLQESKNAFIKQHRVHFISPSHWINESISEKINGLNGKITHIPHSIDTKIFKPSDKIEIRKKYNLNIDALIVLFPQGRWDDEKKGASWYTTIINNIKDYSNPNRVLYFVKLNGDKFKSIQLTTHLFEVTLPRAEDSYTMANYYQLADVSVSLSEIETFGLCVAESLACRTPVLARKANGINELLNNDSRIIANDTQELTEMLLKQSWKNPLFDNLYNQIGQELATEKWANKHIKLYEA